MSCGSNAENHTVALSAMKGGVLETAKSAGSFNTLLAAVKAAGLEDALAGDGPFTVFAPTDEAFAKLPKETLATLLKPENKKQLASILTYHVVSGDVMAADVVRMSGAKTLNGQRITFTTNNGSVMANNAKVVTPNIECDNGVIHVIDTVILPASDNIVVKGQSAGTFGTLLAAASAAGLGDLLKSEGPFTLLAPNDDAFAKLPAGTVESLLKSENKAKLADILKYHVIPGRVYASDAFAAQKAKTAQGQSVVFSVRDGRLSVDGANIIATDIDASNGVIHVIDRVILPSS
jgi:uncharacterized surface protein with fasciclin (FAS1) repeats